MIYKAFSTTLAKEWVLSEALLLSYDSNIMILVIVNKRGVTVISKIFSF